MTAILLPACATNGSVTETVDTRHQEHETEVQTQIATLQQTLDESAATVARQAAQLGEAADTANNAFALATTADSAAAQDSADALTLANRRLVFDVVITDAGLRD